MRKGFLMALLAGLVAFSACEDDSKEGTATIGLDGTYSRTTSSATWYYTGTQTFSGNTIVIESRSAVSEDAVDRVWTTTREIIEFSDNPDGGFKVAYLTTKEELTLIDQETVDYCNEEAYYGYTDWALNVKKDISNRNYEDGSFHSYNPYYDILKLEGNSLYFGLRTTQNNGTSDGSRPIEYSETDVWTKQ